MIKNPPDTLPKPPCPADPAPESAATVPLAMRIERIAVVVAIFVGVAHRLLFGWLAPLWLDESYTGVIASQVDVAGLWDWCRHELSGPVFYAPMWLWVKMAGNSDVALRLPSLICSLAAVAVTAAWGGPDRRERILWASMIAVWVPGLMFAAQARPQALLFLLATIQAIAFLRCTKPLPSRWPTIWALVSAMMLLTHIYAAAIVGLQFFCIVSLYRDRLRYLWPVAAIFAVAAAWLPLQLSFMLAFLKPGVASYARLGPGSLRHVLYDLLGLGNIAFVIVIAVVGIAGTQIVQYRRTGRPLPYSRGEAMLALTGLISIVVVVAFGMLRSSYASRYLIPFVPAMLFGFVCMFGRTRGALSVLPSMVLAAWAGATVEETFFYSSLAAQQTLYQLEFERGSDWLMAHHARRVMFVWDNPTSALNRADLQSEVGGFFFRRANSAVEVRSVYVPRRLQSAAHLAELADRQGAAILWIGGTPYPAALHDVAHFDCRDWGRGDSRSMACARR